MSKTFKEITDTVIQFCKERDWVNQKPNQLIASILIELGELAEHYQWSEETTFDDKKTKEVAYEFVDILIYLIELAHSSGIDIEKAFDEKLPKLEKKFPPKLGHSTIDYKKIKEDYRKSGKNKTLRIT